MVVTRPADISNIFSAPSRAALNWVPLPRNRTRQGDQKSGPVYGQSLGTVQQKSAATDGFGDDPQLVLNGNPNAVTHIFRATGPRERQAPDAPGELAQRITRCNHLVAGAQPRP